MVLNSYASGKKKKKQSFVSLNYTNLVKYIEYIISYKTLRIFSGMSFEHKYFLNQ